MDKIIRATKLFNKNQHITDNQRVLFCVEAEDKNSYLEHSQLIALYDLDNDGIIRIAFPGNPYVNNMYFSRSKEVEFQDNHSLNKLKNKGEKGVQIKYFHAFNHLKDIEDPSEAIEVVMDCNTQIVLSLGRVESEDKTYKVASK